jgi:hypothetical protein
LSHPKIAFCTTVKGRAQHLKLTLPRNLADNASYENAVFVVLDYGSQDDLNDYIWTHHRRELESGRLALYHFHDGGPFRMAHAKNMAHRLGILEGAEILVNLDADNYTGPYFAHYVADEFRIETKIFMWARMIKEGPDRLSRGISGRIVVTRKAFEIAGGYDERFETWGPDDKDFNFRLQRLGFVACEIDRKFLASVPHNEKMRFREYPQARDGVTAYDFEEVCESETTIANFGNVGCGTLVKNFGKSAVALNRMPTRIFGIGMHKTATTSLHHALEILGYDSAHWKSTAWVRAIWREISWTGRSPTLEKNYALCDLPIPSLYRQLDHAYPGSKFILTLRDEERWLKSVEDHWNPEINPFRAGWDTDSFSHRMHEIVYGRRDFDRATMLARYRRHNEEAIRYFRDRRGDLLVMDMDFGWPYRKDGGAGWAELCGFLGKPIVGMPYPKSFAKY